MYIGEFQPCNEHYFPIQGDDIKETLLLQNSIKLGSRTSIKKFCIGQVTEKIQQSSEGVDHHNIKNKTKYYQSVNFSSKPWHICDLYHHHHHHHHDDSTEIQNIYYCNKRKNVIKRYYYVISVLEHYLNNDNYCLKVIAQFQSSIFTIGKTYRLITKFKSQSRLLHLLNDGLEDYNNNDDDDDDDDDKGENIILSK